MVVCFSLTVCSGAAGSCISEVMLRSGVVPDADCLLVGRLVCLSAELPARLTVYSKGEEGLLETCGLARVGV